MNGNDGERRHLHSVLQSTYYWMTRLRYR